MKGIKAQDYVRDSCRIGFHPLLLAAGAREKYDGSGYAPAGCVPALPS